MEGFDLFVLFDTKNVLTCISFGRLCDTEACLIGSLSTLDMVLWVSFRGKEPPVIEEKVCVHFVFINAIFLFALL